MAFSFFSMCAFVLLFLSNSVHANAETLSLYQNARKAPAFRPGMNSACSKAAHRFLN